MVYRAQADGVLWDSEHVLTALVSIGTHLPPRQLQQLLVHRNAGKPETIPTRHISADLPEEALAGPGLLKFGTVIKHSCISNHGQLWIHQQCWIAYSIIEQPFKFHRSRTAVSQQGN